MPQSETDHYDLCIIGAGIGGLNALHVASGYMGSDQRVVLVDRNDRVGGMWGNTYDYVRLHQPHPFFTAGNVAWTFGKERSHLSSKSEVLDHFQHCVAEARKEVHITELLGHEMRGIEEEAGIVRVTCRSAEGKAVTVTADRVINAAALDIDALEPLRLSSGKVRSVSPESCDVRAGEIADSDAPVWIIGSGKTAMDTAHTLIASQPSREINMLAGTGTFFLERDRLYPTGAQRWWRGTRPNFLTTDFADRFDGTNELEVFDWFRDHYGTGPIPNAKHFVLGMLSRAESDRIRDGLNRVMMGHLADVVDTPDGAALQLRDGHQIEMASGSWVVNCTSHLTYREHVEHTPYVSASGRVITLGTSAMFGFSSFAGYFLTHLLFSGKIREVPLYQADGNAMLRSSKSAYVAAMVTLAQYNLSVAFEHLPSKAFGSSLGLDFDRWYPPPRRMVGQVKFLVRHKRQREHYRQSLDRLATRLDVPIGPVISVR